MTDKMYTEKEVKELLKMQIKRCSDIAGASFGNHVLKRVAKTRMVPLIILPKKEIKKECDCDKNHICSICYKKKGYEVIDGKLTKTIKI